MQTAIMSYCLKNALPENERTIENILHLASKEGIENVEIYAGQWRFDDIRKVAESIRKVADGAGLKLPVYGSGTRIGHIGPQRQPCMNRLKQEVEACAILGGKVLTFPVIDGQPIPPSKESA